MHTNPEKITKSKKFIYLLVFVLAFALLSGSLVYLHHKYGNMEIYNPVYTGDYKEDLGIYKIAAELDEHNISCYEIRDGNVYITFLPGTYGNYTLYATDVTLVENHLFILLNDTSYPRCTYDEALQREKYIEPTEALIKEIIHDATGEYPVKEKLYVPD